LPKRLATHLRTLDSREEKLDTLLENYEELCDPLQARSLEGSGKRIPESRRLQMPLVWKICYRDLDRCLLKMRVLAATPGVASPQFKAWFLNLNEWYFLADKRRVPTMRRDKKGREYQVTTANGPQYSVEIRRGGDPGLVLQGLTWLSLDHPNEIRLPSEVEKVA
jgi:hypothetical protein